MKSREFPLLPYGGTTSSLNKRPRTKAVRSICIIRPINTLRTLADLRDTHRHTHAHYDRRARKQQKGTDVTSSIHVKNLITIMSSNSIVKRFPITVNMVHRRSYLVNTNTHNIIYTHIHI